MTKLFTIAALATLAVAYPALANNERSTFSRDGVTYSYTKTKVGQSTIYKGQATPGQSFYLVERAGKVFGTANGVQVRFDVPKASDAVAAAGSR